MTDFEMDKMYTITGREFLALLSLIPDGDEKAKVIVGNVAGREKVNEIDFLGLPAEEGLPCTRVDCERLREMRMTELKPCPFCGSEHVKLQHYKIAPNDWWYVSCCECQIAMDPLLWDCQTKEQAIERWNKRYLNGMPISLHTMVPRDEE